MNRRPGSSPPTIEQVQRSKPCRPSGPREEHVDDAERLLQRLRQVGAVGITTGELIREGCCGLRPPNRIGDLRRVGHLIETVREGNGVFRFILVRENPNPEPKRKRKRPSSSRTQVRESDYMRPLREERAKAMPLFAGVRK